MEEEYKIGVVIVAAGSGLRFGERKQFKKLKNKPLYLYSLEKFIDCDMIDEIVLVVPEDLTSIISDETSRMKGLIKVISGGKLRQDSTLNGVNALDQNCNIICIHDAARPFIKMSTINNVIEMAKKYDGAIVATPSNDTVKEVAKNTDRIKHTVPRDTIWLAQTPQVFHRDKLLQALAYANTNNITVTDESSLLEALDFSVAVVGGSSNNFKITTQEDWRFAELILEENND